MTEMELLIDLHRQQARQGPGSDAQTRLMMSLAGLENTAGLQIADIGCGTGASSVLLATELGAEVTAVDFLPEFLAELTTRAAQAGVANHIQTMACDMTELPFADSAFDVLWAEGAIYNIGFEKGVQQWRRFLKPDGVLVAPEITWTTAARPDDIEAYWQANYPESDTASVKIKQLEAAGYRPLAYTVLPTGCWLENYYRPLEDSFQGFIQRHGNSSQAKALVDAEREEIAMYTANQAYYSYGVYIAQRLDSESH